MSKKPISLLTKEQRQAAIDEIIFFFANQRDEQIGIIAAQDILDMFLENISKAVYNRGVDDTKELIKERMLELETDVELTLKK
ncbi:MAG: DUF2164 family protein [Candidatus Pacebacteria bacterium]|nr:DUF2164 family protein [Candidatus Paceibacterota bacterium]